MLDKFWYWVTTQDFENCVSTFGSCVETRAVVQIMRPTLVIAIIIVPIMAYVYFKVGKDDGDKR